MPSPPTLFDDGGELPEDPVATGADDPVPNYFFRRALVVGGVVAVIAAAAVLAGRLIGSGGDGSSSGAASADWNRIVMVEDRTGRVIVVDETGEDIARLDSGVRTPNDTMVVGSTAVLSSDDVTAVVSLSDETTETFDLAADTVLAPSGTTLTMVAPATSGDRALIVHGPSGDVIDTAEFAPIAGARYDVTTARSATSGRDVLVTDIGNFQSVLLSFDRDEPSYFPGLALAVDGEHVVTTQNVGSNATVSAFDHRGEPLSSATTPSVRAAMITGDTVRLVTVEGQIVTMSLGSGDTDTGEILDIGTVESGHVIPTGDRLVVIGTAGTALVDDAGRVVANYDGLIPVDEAALRGSQCITLTDMAASSDGELTIVDVTDGTTVIEAAVTATSILRSADGCTIVAADATGYDVVSADGVQRFDDDTVIAIAPDAASTAAERDRRIVLVELGDTSDDEPLDLGATGRSVFFTQV